MNTDFDLCRRERKELSWPEEVESRTPINRELVHANLREWAGVLMSEKWGQKDGCNEEDPPSLKSSFGAASEAEDEEEEQEQEQEGLSGFWFFQEGMERTELVG